MSIELADAVELDLTEMVDELAGIHAKITDLTTRADELKAQLILSGESKVNGTLHKVSISFVAEAVSTDWKAACVAAKVKPAVLAQCQKKKAGYTVVKLAAR